MKNDIKDPVQNMDTDRKATVVPMPFMNTKQSRDIPVRESLSWFSGKMEEELRIFDSTMSAWETEAALAILDDLDEQVIELRSQFLIAMRGTQPKVQNAVINRCVQVANLAHMIASCHHPILSHCRKGKSINPRE
ncbi:MAG: hypothetical protein HY881_01720 [Deltaproteobacteria bacterium]|nr:hypothetical protein [Deltaproteobacteria bacterium]